jgi:hypothetical protein
MEESQPEKNVRSAPKPKSNTAGAVVGAIIGGLIIVGIIVAALFLNKD